MSLFNYHHPQAIGMQVLKSGRRCASGGTSEGFSGGCGFPQEPTMRDNLSETSRSA
jgi:hypothetical protein